MSLIGNSLKKTVFSLLTLLFNFAYGFHDAELYKVWASIVDINNPTLEEYKLIESYLNCGKRPYLDDLRKSALMMDDLKMGCFARLNLMLNFKLVGYNDEMPLFEKFSFNINENSKNRCIVLFCSYNGIYPNKARKVLSELKQRGYSGHVLLRIGGFPNLENEGIKLCHVPYAFKVSFLREAQLLGYKEVLWIDSALHPLTNLEEIFSEIKERGYFFTSVGTLSANHRYHLPNAATSLHIDATLYDQISHISSSIIGLNLENQRVAQLLKNWHRETESIYPNITWFPEELSLSVVAWQLQCRPSNTFGNIVCAEHELSHIQHRPKLQFFLDALR